MNDLKETRWCKTHAPKLVGKDQFGNFYDVCYTGHIRKEKCEIIIEQLKESETRAI